MKNPVPLLLSSCLIVALQSSSLAAPEAGKAGKAGKTASPGGKVAVGSEKPAVSDPVAVVDGEEILLADVDDALSQVLAQQGQSLGAVPAEQKLNFYRMLIEDLIVERLVKKRAAGLEVSKEQVDEVYRRATEGIPPEELKAQMKQVGQTEAKLRSQIQNNLQQREWMEKQVQGQDEVGDAEAEAFYTGNLDKFKKPELVKASHILVSVAADATPETVLEREKKAKSLFDRVKKGEDFASLAKEFSDDPGSKERGGDLDFFAKDQMVPEFAEAAFSLKKDEVSQPVRSQFGYHVIKATDRKPEGTATLAEAKPQLMAYLKRQKKQSAVEEVVRGLRAGAKVKINLPEPAPGVEAAQPAPR
jgi:peptidyl-prolyl cis-trans isomerase C